MATRKKKTAPKSVKKTAKKATRKVAKAASVETAAEPAEEPVPPPAPPAPSAPKVNKTEFILIQPMDMPAKQVVAKAAEAGFELTEKAVYNARTQAKKKAVAAKEAKKAARKAAKEASTVAALEAATPAKKGRPVGSGFGNKSEFIRQQPLDMPPADVVAAGKEAGISFTAGLVYGVRKQMKKAGKGSSAATGAKRRGRPPKAASQVAVPSGVSDRERRLVQLALDVGLARAIELINEIKVKVTTLI